MSDFAKKMPFGKYKGRSFAEIPRGYLSWLERTIKLKPFLAGAVAEALGKEYRRKPSRPVPSVERIGRDYIPSTDTTCPFDV